MTTLSKPQLWTGRILCWFVILFMLFDASIKFMKLPEVIKTTVGEPGYSEHHIPVHGTLALIATILFAIPRLSVFGALLLTGYLGGAIATHLE